MKPFERVLSDIKSRGLRLHGQDLERPWGGFYIIDESQIEEFVRLYFPAVKLPRPQDRLPMQPKILIVAPHQRLSWQYHHRRAEEWRVLEGPVGVAHGQSDEQAEPQVVEAGATLRLATGERHRLCGLDNWGVVAEIWVHTDPTAPSNEADIVRLQDDYNR